jgi:ABC-type antimicrobial peptide transport system permease subunit
MTQFITSNLEKQNLVIPQFEFKLPPPKQNARGTVWFHGTTDNTGWGLDFQLAKGTGVFVGPVFIVVVLVENVVIAVTNLKSCIFLCIVKLIKAVPVTVAHRGGDYRCAPRVSPTVCAL